MNLINFHKYDKNIPYVAELLVIHEMQGNYDEYFMSICGDMRNIYTLSVRDSLLNKTFDIIIEEKYIHDWRIGEGSHGGSISRSQSKYFYNELTFEAIGKIKDTNKAVYLEHNKENDFSCLKMNNKDIIEVLDISIENTHSIFEKPNPEKMYFTCQFYRDYRYHSQCNYLFKDDSGYREYYTFQKAILTHEFINYDYHKEKILIRVHEETPYIDEIHVLHESQGNCGECFVNIFGNKHNRYLFFVNHLLSNDTFIINIEERFIEEWIIRQINKYNTYDELTFMAIGKIEDTNQAVYLCVENDTNCFTQLTMNGKDIIEVSSIIVYNEENRLSPTPINNISTCDYYNKYRSQTYNNKDYENFKDKLLSNDFINYDNYIENHFSL